MTCSEIMPASFEFGGIEWDAIAHERGCVLLLAHDAVGQRAFHGRKRCPEWNKSDIRSYLNGEFLDSLTPEERDRIVPVLVVNGASTRRTGNSVDAVDRVWLLSDGEVRQLDPALRQASCRWWLRTPGADSYYTAHVETRGVVSSFGSTVISAGLGVRPAMWVKMEDDAEMSITEPSEWAFSALDASTKVRVEVDYLASLSDGMRPLNPMFHDHAVRQTKRILELALSRVDSGDVLTGMIREGLVTARNIDEILERVTQLGDVDLMALLLDYKGKGLSAEDLEKEERRRENEALRLFNPWSVEELKKVWKYRKGDEGIILESYMGSGPIVAVPESFGRTPVLGLDCAFPKEAAHLILPDIEAPSQPFAGTVHASARFAEANAGWLARCGGYCELQYGEGCIPEGYVPAAQMAQGKLRMMPVADQLQRFGCAVFGSYAWDLVRETDEAMLLISHDIVSRKPYNQTQADAEWHEATLRAWFNGEFLNQFTIREKQQLLKVPVKEMGILLEEADARDVFDQVDRWLAAHPDDLGDSFFILSAREAKELLSLDQRSASAAWWLRDPGIGSKSAMYVLSDGRLFDVGGFVSSPRMGVRPVAVVAKQAQ